jgi:hypothetical protein
MDREPPNGMSRLVALMVRLPIDFFVMGMDLMMRNVWVMQDAIEETADGRTAGTLGLGGADLTPTDASVVYGAGATVAPAFGGLEMQTSHSEQEGKQMGIDLGGDDAKNVSYWITFVKPDFVATLQDERDETIDYATDEGSFGGLKMGDFFQQLTTGEILLPSAWNPSKLPEDYTIGTNKSGKKVLHRIPDRDKKYIRVKMKLNWRHPIPDAEREKDKVDELRGIRSALQNIERQLGEE